MSFVSNNAPSYNELGHLNLIRHMIVDFSRALNAFGLMRSHYGLRVYELVVA